MSTTFNGVDQAAVLGNITQGQRVYYTFTLDEAYQDFTGTARYLVDNRVVSANGYIGTQGNSSTVFRLNTFLVVDGVGETALDSVIGYAGSVIRIKIETAGTDGNSTLFSKNDFTEFNRIVTSKIEVYDTTQTVVLHSFDLTNPTSANVPDDVGSGTLTLVGFTFPDGPTLTGPDSTTDGTATQATGTDLDTITTFSLISGTYTVGQTIDGQTATTLDYVASSGVNDCVPGTPVNGVPLEATITAPGITPYVVQQKVDDGTNPPTTRDITLNAPATHDVIQTMIASANTIDDQSIFGTSWVNVEDNHQAAPPRQVDGVNFTWNADGTFTTDQDKTVVARIPYFAPSTGQYGCIDFTVQGSTIISSGMITPMIEPMISNMIEDM